MKKLTIKKLIQFRTKSAKGKKRFAASIKVISGKAKRKGGGDYWQIAVSAIANACKTKNPQIISDKIKEFEEKMQVTTLPTTKALYKANIEVLRKYEGFEFSKWTPVPRIYTEDNHRFILLLQELLVESAPQYVFSFGKAEVKEIGAIWFIARKKMFKAEEMGMFADILFRNLKSEYGKQFAPNPKYCIALELLSGETVTYSQLQSGEVPFVLNKTIDELKKLL